MNDVLALIGITGKKSGGVLAEYVGENLDEVKSKFPGGIRALVRETSDVSKLKKCIPSAEICTGSLDDTTYLTESLTGVDTVINVAGISYSSNIVRIAAACGVRRMILIHTTGIYSKYKAAGEEYRRIDDYVYDICRKNNIILTICRPTMIYGNVHDNNVVTFIKMVDKLPIMPVVNGAMYELQPVHYNDLGKAYFNILMNEEATANKDYNLSGGAPIMLRNMLEVIGHRLDKNVKFISCPFPIAYAGAWAVYLLTIGKKDYREKVQRLCEPRTFTHEDAEMDFGYRPMMFEDGIVGEVNEYLTGCLP